MSRSVGVSFLEKRKPNVQKCTPPPPPQKNSPFFFSNISLHHHPFARGKHRYVFAEVTRKQVANEAFNFGKVTSMQQKTGWARRRKTHRKKERKKHQTCLPRLYMWLCLLATLLFAWPTGDEGGGGRKASSKPIELRWSLPA